MIARSPGLRLARAEASRLAGARLRRRRCCGQPPGNVGDRGASSPRVRAGNGWLILSSSWLASLDGQVIGSA